MKRKIILKRQELPQKQSEEWHTAKYAFFHSKTKVCGLLFLILSLSCTYVLISHDIRYEWVLAIGFTGIPTFLAMFVFMWWQAKISRKELQKRQWEDV